MRYCLWLENSRGTKFSCKYSACQSYQVQWPDFCLTSSNMTLVGSVSSTVPSAHSTVPSHRPISSTEIGARCQDPNGSSLYQIKSIQWLPRYRLMLVSCVFQKTLRELWKYLDLPPVQKYLPHLKTIYQFNQAFWTSSVLLWGCLGAFIA